MAATMGLIGMAQITMIFMMEDIMEISGGQMYMLSGITITAGMTMLLAGEVSEAVVQRGDFTEDSTAVAATAAVAAAMAGDN